MSDPLHQFEIAPLAGMELSLMGYDVSFTNSSLWMLIAVLTSTMIMTLTIRRNSLIPGRLQNITEMLYEFISNMVDDSVGPDGRKFFPLVFSIFMFVLMGNMLGMIPYAFTFTSHIIVTFALSMFVFLFVTLLGIFRHGFHFFSLFVPSGVPIFMAPILVPIEILSYLSRPISLSVRLFANMMAGHTMLKVFAGFCVSLGVIFGLAPLAINVALVGFEILVAFLQAYVFTILTCLYLKDSIDLH